MYAVMTIKYDGYDDVRLEYPSFKAARREYYKFISCPVRFALLGVGSQRGYVRRHALKEVAVRELMA